MTFFGTGLVIFMAGTVLQLVVNGPGHPLFWGPLLVGVPFFAWAYRTIRRDP